MKLERLEGLNLISTKNLLVNEVLRGLDKKFYYNKFELEINLALVMFTVFGNTEMHKAMDSEDIQWIDFVNENYKLIEEIKKDENYGKIYDEIFNEILIGAEYKTRYNNTIGSMLEDLGNLFTEENIGKIKEAIENIQKGEDEVTEQ